MGTRICPICGAAGAEAHGGGTYFCKTCFGVFSEEAEAPRAPSSSHVDMLLKRYGSGSGSGSRPRAEKPLEQLSAEELKKMASAETDPQKAFSIWREAAERGDAEAAYRVACAYETGNGIGKDLSRAAFWYGEGASRGNTRCGVILRERFGGGQNPAVQNPAVQNPLTPVSAPVYGNPNPAAAPAYNTNPNLNANPAAAPANGNAVPLPSIAPGSNPYPQFYLRFLPSIVRVGARFGQSGSCGTGFILRDGTIATNAHVVLNDDGQPASQITLNFSPTVSKRLYGARLLAYDVAQDIAFLQCTEENDFPSRAVPIGDSSVLLGGDDTFTIGNGKDYGIALTKLTVSQPPMPGTRFGKYDEVIQLAGNTQPGNSGGPLFNMQGEVVGIITFHPTNQQGIMGALPAPDGSGLVVAKQVVETAVDGVRFAITSNTLKRIAAREKVML